ncbi:MAG: 2-oxo acid dehydrogenase subunit E2 [Rhodocyclaceae bacterium]|nr:2-oxo acid dehydrogenase subunit E2 [Rhodocyclaceae bacterium]
MIEFRLPALGADMEEGTLLEWKVKPGDVIRKGQVIAVVDTAKTAIDVEAWQEGIVHRLIAEPGQKMPVGAVMALLLAPGESPPTPEAGVAETGTTAAVAQEDARAEARRRISPAARRRAEALGVDLDTVVGTGPQGAVTLADVESAAHAHASRAADSHAQSMRAAIAAAMTRAKREIPHYYLCEEIPLAKALAWLTSHNAGRPLAERLLPASLLLKAVALALRRYPEFNGFFREGRFVSASQINPGVAITTPQGLLAPALFAADTKPLTVLNHELCELVARTRAGRLTDAELREATVTVSNLGDQGPQAAFAVIVPPQVAIIAFGRILERPWASEGRLEAIPTVMASLSADHRVSDGHRGGLLLREIAENLQHPEEMEA